MPVLYRYKLHDGRVLWPEHKSEAEVLDLRATTPENVWLSTYQGVPQPPGGAIFQPAWWGPTQRYDPNDSRLQYSVVARWLSWDTGLKDNDGNAYTACVVGELLPDYRLLIRHVYRERLSFALLPDMMTRIARQFHTDEKLRGILVEDKASGISALQTLGASSEAWLAGLLISFAPMGSKEYRAEQASVWCQNGCVLLPTPSDAVPWLYDFEDELFTAPGGQYMDQVDALAQLIIYLEHLLADGYRLREGMA